MGFNDPPIDASALAKIIGIDDEISLSGHRLAPHTGGNFCRHRGFPPLHTGIEQESSEHLVGIEVFSRNVLGCPGMFLIVAVDGLNSGENIR
jgi:hypothetical protein